MIQIFDLTETSFFPSTESIFVVLVLHTISYYLLKRSLNPEYEYNKLIYILGFIYLLVFSGFWYFGMYGEYKRYKGNIASYQSGEFETITGRISHIEFYWGNPSQSLVVENTRFYSEKGSSFSYDKSFRNFHEIGQIVTIEYVDSYNGLIRVSVDNCLNNCESSFNLDPIVLFIPLILLSLLRRRFYSMYLLQLKIEHEAMFEDLGRPNVNKKIPNYVDVGKHEKPDDPKLTMLGNRVNLMGILTIIWLIMVFPLFIFFSGFYSS